MANSEIDEDLKKIDYSTKLEQLDPVRKQKYKNLLMQLQDMGFLDFDRNLRTAERIGTDIVQVMEDLAKPEQRGPQLLPMPSANQGQPNAQFRPPYMQQPFQQQPFQQQPI